MPLLSLWEYFAVAVLFACCSYLLTPLFIFIANEFDVVDKPNQPHKTHSKPVPYLGGFSIVVPLTTAITVFPLFAYSEKFPYYEFFGVVAIPTILAIVGAIDDKWQLSALSRFIIQIITSLILIKLFISKDWIGSPFENDFLNFTLSLLWLVGITNSINFFDNLDGGAAGFAVICSVSIFIIAYNGDQFAIALVALALSGSCLGLLYWNRNPARIYLGDAGALYVGMLLAILTIRLDPVSDSRVGAILTPVFLMAIPIIDTTVAVLSRLRRKISPFVGGQDHLSHRLQRFGFTRRKSAFVLWKMASLSCVFALAIQFASVQWVLPIILVGIVGGLTLLWWFMKQSDSNI